MRILLASLLVPLAACAAPSGSFHQSIESLSSLESIELTYEGAISSEGLPAAVWDGADVDRTGPTVDFQVSLFEVDRDVLPAIWEGGESWTRADRVKRTGATELLDELVANEKAAVFSNPRILIHRGTMSNMVISNSISFVNSFSIKTMGGTTIADPEIEIKRDGILVEVSSAKGSSMEQCEIHLKLSLAKLQRPIPETVGLIPGTTNNVTVQTPIFCTQQIELSTLLGSDDALLVGPLAPFKGERAIVVLLTADLFPEGPQD
ncbi:MAG: hypothetical protein ACI9F9_000452 [Candidatus Paceibacteria bacterium]|jgi:hypothetical protein